MDENKSVTIFLCTLVLAIAGSVTAIGVSNNVWGKPSEERIQKLEECIHKLEEKVK